MTHWPWPVPGTLAILIALTGGCGLVKIVNSDIPDVPQYSALQDPAHLETPALHAASAAVVRISTKTSVGTGFFIDDGGRLLTNNHVVGLDNCPPSGCYLTLDLLYERGAERARLEAFARPLAASPALDASLLAIYHAPEAPEQEPSPYLPDHWLGLSPEIPSIGDAVTIIGHPGGLLKKFSTGHVFAPDGDWLQADYFSLPGQSGSPVLDESGRVVGINHRGSYSAGNVSAREVLKFSIFTGAPALQDFLDQASRNPGLPLVGDDGEDRNRRLESAELMRGLPLYRNARWLSLVDGNGEEWPLPDLYGGRCDEMLGLVQDDPAATLRRPEDFAALADTCKAALPWLGCAELSPETACPEEDGRQIWADRFATLGALESAFWGDQRIRWTLVDTAGVFAADDAAARAARAEVLRTEVEAKKPGLTFSLARRMLDLGVATEDLSMPVLKDYVVHYTAQPGYRYNARSIFWGLWYLYQNDQLSMPFFNSMVRDMFDNREFSLDDHLLIESYMYALDLIK